MQWIDNKRGAGATLTTSAGAGVSFVEPTANGRAGGGGGAVGALRLNVYNNQFVLTNGAVVSAYRSNPTYPIGRR